MSTAKELGERIKAAMHASLMSNKVEAEMSALVDELVSLAPAEQAAGAWMPIETMPMRQTVLLAIDGKWVTTGDRWPNPVGIFWDDPVDDDESDESAPTHWMPLPEPPTATALEEPHHAG